MKAEAKIIKKKMNKSGNIPITILVIGVFAICGIAIFSFYLSESKTKIDSAPVQLIEKLNSFKEEISFYKNLGKEPTSEMEVFQKPVVAGSFLQNMTFTGDKSGQSLDGVFVKDSKRILWVKYDFSK